MIGKKEPLASSEISNKSYRRGNQLVPVLRDITVDIAEEEFLALMDHPAQAEHPPQSHRRH